MKKKDNPDSFKNATIYYASGTGNSYRIARWIETLCRKKGMSIRFDPVNEAKPEKEIIPSKEHLLLLTFPTHGLLPPWSVIKFLFKIPCSRKSRFLCMPTRGSLFIGRLLIPGAAGFASFFPSLILLLKGFRPKGSVSFDMPVNITSIHPSLSKSHARRIVAAAEKKFNKYLNRFFLKGSLWFTWNNLWELFWCGFFYFFPLFPILYLLIGRFFMGKIMFFNHHCNGCNVCADICPNKAIIMKGKKKKRPYWRYNCEACLRCLNFCPQHAITTGHFWAVLLWITAGTLTFGGILYTWLSIHLPFLNLIRNWWTVELLNTLIYYPFIILAYYLFFQLIQFKFFNHIFHYLSFSPIFKQYREPDTSLKDWKIDKSIQELEKNND
jgi:ferredoxin